MSDHKPVFNQLNLVVSDMDATLAFYRRLGLEIPDTDPTWEKHHRFAVMPDGLDLDFDSVEFARQWNEGWSGRAGGSMGVLGIGLPTRDAVDQTYVDIVDAGYKSQQVPYDAFWGSRYAIVEDPDGNAVGLMSPMDPEHRTDPSAPPAG